MITFLFVASTILFLATAIQNLFLYHMYRYGYLQIKNSKIINSLVNLFFWKTVAFLFLAAISVANIFQDKNLSIILRGVGLIPFIFVFYWLNEFAKWSVEKEDIVNEKK